MSSALEVWYAIPTANPTRATACFAAWKERGYRTAALCDEGSGAPQGADLVIHVAEWPGYYRSIRLLCRAIQSADIVVAGGDDMYPDPHHQSQELAEQYYERFPDGFGVMQPIGDPLWGTDKIAGSPWFGREWIRRAYQGQGPHCCEYAVWHGDQELKLVAEQLGVYWPRRELNQRHEHWWRTGKRTDYQLRNQRLYWKADSEVFSKRKSSNFPGHEPLDHD